MPPEHLASYGLPVAQLEREFRRMSPSLDLLLVNTAEEDVRLRMSERRGCARRARPGVPVVPPSSNSLAGIVRCRQRHVLANVVAMRDDAIVVRRLERIGWRWKRGVARREVE